ncbi:MAG: family 10 glycosylhydrolase, partial [Syntrophobacteraceae bacterium]
RETISRIKAAGFNVYIPCVWHGRGTRYPCSLAPPEEKLLFKGEDPLARLIRIAHENNIEVHPWFCVALRQRDFLNDYFDPGTPSMAFDLHKPGFRQFIKNLIVDLAMRYDIDGIQLDYIRTGGICTSESCCRDYEALYGRSLIEDLKKRNPDGSLESHVQEWQDKAVQEIVRTVSKEAKAIKPLLVVSVWGHPQLPNLGLPANPEGRREIPWANNGLVDLILCGEYGNRPDFQGIALVSKHVPSNVSVLITLGNYDKPYGGSVGTITPRNAKLVADLVAFAQRLSDRGVALYLYSQLTDEQILALRRGPFSLDARPYWNSRKPHPPNRLLLPFEHEH